LSDISVTDPCVIFSLGRESRPFLREFRPQQRFPGAPCWARFCGPSWLSILVLEAGVGAAATEGTLDWLLGAPTLNGVVYRPKVVLSTGFCGALCADLHIGDVVLATDVVDADGRVHPVTWPDPGAPGLVGDWEPPLRRGRVLTMPRLIGSSAEKRRLGEHHQALAVDMESACVARKCGQHGIPFGCLRAVSDDVATELSPAIATLQAGGRVSLSRALLALLRSPRLLSEFRRLVKDTRRAAEQLGKSLGEVLTLTLPWVNELGD
jgi:nucleoside phosphorylase